jgi:hypothetical protein
MTSSSAWSADAVGRVMTTLRRVPTPATHQTPLELQVTDLAESAVVSSDGEDIAVGDLDRTWFADVSLVLIDAVLARDKRALDALDALLRRLHRVLMIAKQEASSGGHRAVSVDELRCWESWLQLTMEYLRSAMERVAPVAAAAAVKGTHYERFLRIVANHPGINSREIGKVINAGRFRSATEAAGADQRRMDEGQLSKIGNKLRAQGLVFAERSGPSLSWELTPRGLLVVNRLLGAHENADHPVDSMVIATKEVASADVAATLSAAKPREVTVLRGADAVTYERREPALEPRAAVTPESPLKEPPADRVVRTGPVAIDAVVDDLLERIHATAPPVFSIDNGMVYEQVGNRTLAAAVPVGS